ncbi:MAG: DNA polymerase III subunit delta' [Chromatiaceae bacterium]|jgi:DNA polymerase-3 subunit delta'
MSGSDTHPWHAEQWRRISAAHGAQRLPHALLLTGPAGLGKGDFARRLAGALLCVNRDDGGDSCGVCGACRLVLAGTHPDLHFIQPEGPGGMIKIDAIRTLTAKSVLAAQDGGYRVFVLDPAETMNRAAANALLKTLEEPAKRSILLLVSSHPDRLPATIRSRCQIVRFPVPPVGLVRDWLSQAAPQEELDQLLAISGGAPLRALQAREQGWGEEGRALCRELSALKRRQANPVQIIEEWEKRPLTSVLDGLKRCLTDLIRLANGLSGAMLYHPALREDLQSLGQGIELKSLYGFNDQLLDADRELSHNLNGPMLYEHIANRWLEITRPGGR